MDKMPRTIVGIQETEHGQRTVEYIPVQGGTLYITTLVQPIKGGSKELHVCQTFVPTPPKEVELTQQKTGWFFR